MGDGWETGRRREPGHEWIVVKLAARATIESIVVDTAHFKAYNASAAEPDGWQAYMERYVNCGEAEYLARVGGLEAIRQLPLPVF